MDWDMGEHPVLYLILWQKLSLTSTALTSTAHNFKYVIFKRIYFYYWFR